MTISLTRRTELEVRKTRIEPQLVLEIDGVPTFFGALQILKAIRIGDDDLLIGNTWRIGGLYPIDNQEAVLSLDGTGTKIDQQLRPDRGAANSISSVKVALIDRKLVATRLVSPGVVVPDILGRKAVLWMGFRNTAFKEDYVKAISGIIDDVEIGPGLVKLNISHPEQLKRQSLFEPVDVILGEDLDALETTITLFSTVGLPEPQPGPDGSLDPAIAFFIQVEDEIIRYTGISGNDLTGCVRGELGSLAVAHVSTGDPIPGKSMVQIADTAIDIALKIMLSGKNGPFLENLPIKTYLHPTPTTTVANSVFFFGVDLNRDFGIVEGDYVTITGSTIPANNCVAKRIIAQVVNNDGTYIVLDGVTFAEEIDPVAVATFRSQYDTLGYGLGMDPDQVDVEEHVYWRNFQLAAYSYRFVITEKIDGKKFLDEQVYLPVGAYSIPRSGRCSLGYTIGPVIRQKFLILSKSNIKNPDKIVMRRTINRNFYNTIVYRFDEVALTGKAVAGLISISAGSQARIPVGSRALTIDSQGMRRDLDGIGWAGRIASRYLGRYQFAAEFFESIGVMFRDGVSLEPGDVVMLDPAGLNMADTIEGTRKKPAKLFTVINKSLDLKTGDISVSLTDTNFDSAEKYGVVSPSSLVVSGTTTDFLIQDSFGAIFPGFESRKWEDYLGLPVIVHSPDWSFAEEVVLESIDTGNRYRLLLDPSTPLSSPPSAGYIVDIASYPTGTEATENDRYKAAHGFIDVSIQIVDAADDTHFEVAPGDVAKLTIGSYVRIHNQDYSNDTLVIDSLKIDDIAGSVVTVSTSMGFTPSSGDIIEGLSFPDGGPAYRIF